MKTFSQASTGAAIHDGPLQEVVRNMQLILDNTDQIFMVISKDYRILTANKAALADSALLFGHNLSVGDIMPDPKSEYHAARLHQIYADLFSGANSKFTYRYKSPFSNTNYFDLNYTAVKNDAGIVVAVMLNARDVSKEVELAEALRVREEQFRGAFEYSTSGMAIVNPEGMWVEVNESACSMLGYSREELLRLSFQKITHPDDIEQDLYFLQQLLDGSIEHCEFEKRYIHKTGRLVHALLVVYPISPGNGSPVQLVCQLQDITRQKEDAEKLQAKELEYRALIENGADAVVVLDEEGKPVYISPTISKVLGYTVEEASQLDLFTITHPDDLENVAAQWQESLKRPGESIPGYTSRMLHKDGTWRWLEDTMTNMLHEPTINGIVDNFRDVTEKVHARMELEKIMASSVDMICTIDAEGRFRLVSRACETILGYTAEELRNRKFQELVHPDDLENSIAITERIRSGVETTNHQNRYIRRDGNAVHLVWSAKWDDEEQIMYCIARDASEKKNSEAALKQSEERYRYLFYANPLPMWIYAVEDKRFIEVNNAAIEHYGYSREEFLAKTLRDIRPHEDVEAFNNAARIKTGPWEKHEGSWRHIKKNGEIIRVEVTSHIIDYNGQPAGLALLNDITSRINAEEQKEFERRDKEALINTTGDPIWSVNKNFQLIAANKAFLELVKAHTGIWLLPGEDMLLPNHFPKHISAYWHKYYTRAIQGEFFSQVVKTEVSLEGHPSAWFEINFNPIYDDSGISGIACYGRNITEARTYQNQLLRINHQLETAQRIALLGYWELNPKDLTLYWSPQVSAILGITAAPYDMTFTTFLNCIHPDDRDVFIEKQRPALKHGLNMDIEYRIITPDGAIKHIYQRGWIVTDKENEPVRLEGTVQDITSRKKVEEMIRDSEEKRRLIMNAALDAIVCMDSDGMITFWNPQAEKIFGWKHQEVNGRRLSEIILPEEYTSRHEQGISNYMRTGIGPALNMLLELKGRDRSGRIFPIELTVIPIQQGDEKFFCGFIRDITNRKTAENEIRTFNERFKLLSQTTSDAVWDWDLETDEVWWNENFYAIVGYDSTQPVPHLYEWTKKVHDEDREKIITRLRSVRKRTITEWNDEFRFLTSNKGYRTVLDRASVIHDNTGRPIRVIGAIVDITDRKQAEDAIRASNERYDMVARATNDAIYEWDVKNNVNYWGEGYETLFGYTRTSDSMPVETWLDNLHPEERESLLNATHRAFAEKRQSLTRELRFRCADDTYKTVFDKLMIKYDDDGNPMKIYGAMQDITERKRHENSIRALNGELNKRAVELAATNAELERFAYVASHDLQEPLRMVSSFLQLLRKKYEDKLDDTAELYINYAVDGAERMKRLILDLLEYSRATSMSPEMMETSMEEVCRQVEETFTAHMAETGAVLRIQSMPVIRASRSQMIQLIQNLVGNALKYNQSDKPAVEIGVVEMGDHWQFRVTDNGIGIDPKYADKIFVIFQRLHNKNQYSGTGIGLAICKKIVEKHGGDIWIEPVPTGGSSFCFTIKKEP